MQPLDADFHAGGIGHVDDHLARADNGRLELADLVALRQIGIKIIFPVEHRFKIDPRIEPKPGADRLLDALFVDYRQHAGHRRVHQGHMGIGLAAECRRSAREQLGLRGHLGMNFHADDDLPVAGGAFDQFGLRGGRTHSIFPSRAAALFRLETGPAPAPHRRRICAALTCGNRKGLRALAR